MQSHRSSGQSLKSGPALGLPLVKGTSLRVKLLPSKMRFLVGREREKKEYTQAYS